MFFERGEIFYKEQFHRLQAKGLGGLAKFIERNFFVAPFADRVIDAAFEFTAASFFGSSETVRKISGNHGSSRSAGHAGYRGTAGDIGAHRAI